MTRTRHYYNSRLPQHTTHNKTRRSLPFSLNSRNMAISSYKHSEATSWLTKACQLLKEDRWPPEMPLHFDGSDFKEESRDEAALVFFDAIWGWGKAKTISLKNIRLSLRGKEKLGSALDANPFLDNLSLVKVSSDDGRMEFLSRSLFSGNKSIKELTIDSCQIRRQDYHFMRRILGVGHLQVLKLRNLDDVIPTISPYLAHSSLKMLGISGCRANQESLVEMLRSITLNTNIKSLVLQDCGIGSSVKKELNDLLSNNSTLQSVDLRENNIYEETIALLAKGGLRHNNSIQTLILSQNPIGDDGASSIAEMLALNPTIESLGLIDCEIWGRGCMSLASGLASMKGLKELFVDGDMEDFAHVVLQSLESNMSLHHLWTDRTTYLIHRDRTWRQVEFFLRLNRAKRRILVEPSVPVSLWPIVLEGVSGDPRLIYHLLRQKPELISTKN